MKKPLLFALMIFTFISCDPPHNIYFINESNSAAQVKISLDPNVESLDWEEIRRENLLDFKVPQNDTVRLEFGIGDWSDNEVKKVVSSIQNIEIETADFKKIYKSQGSIQALLEENREGFFFKTNVYIEIE